MSTAPYRAGMAKSEVLEWAHVRLLPEETAYLSLVCHIEYDQVRLHAVSIYDIYSRTAENAVQHGRVTLALSQDTVKQFADLLKACPFGASPDTEHEFNKDIREGLLTEFQKLLDAFGADSD
jgi:hypothetical protein